MILLNRPSCSPDDLFGQGIDLNWTHVHRPPLHTRIRGNLQIVGAYLFQTSFTHIHMNTLYTHIHTHQPLFHTHSPEEKKKRKNKKTKTKKAARFSRCVAQLLSPRPGPQTSPRGEAEMLDCIAWCTLYWLVLWLSGDDNNRCRNGWPTRRASDAHTTKTVPHSVSYTTTVAT